MGGGEGWRWVKGMVEGWGAEGEERGE